MTKSPKEYQPIPESRLQTAVAVTPDLQKDDFKRGLGALESKDKQAGLIVTKDPRLIQGSIYLDKATETLYYDCNRWDYVIEYDGNLFYYEPHPALNNENIKEISGKVDWLKWWLKNKAPEIRNMGTKGFYWVHTGKCDVPRESKQLTKLMDIGVRLVNRLTLK